MTRAKHIKDFLAAADWQTAQRSPLAGDASNRRYERLKMGTKGAVLMDAPRDKGEDVGPFMDITDHLRGAGLSAPEILAADREAGFLLLEDLGDDLFARVVDKDTSAEEPLYLAAIEALWALHAVAPPVGTRAYAPQMGDLAGLAATWYGDGQKSADIAQTVDTAIADLATGTPVLALRDFHAENLIWLPERTGPARVGLLDYQDALLAHPAYDLASLLYDARRDVSETARTRAVDHYLALSGFEKETFMAAFAAVSAQRNLRILGVFARLSLRDNKPHYVDLIPRVWGNLQSDLSHPALVGVARAAGQLAPPTQAHLQSLKNRAGTCPAL